MVQAPGRVHTRPGLVGLDMVYRTGYGHSLGAEVPSMIHLYVMIWLCSACGFQEPRAPMITYGLTQCQAVAKAWVKENGGTFICASIPTGGFIWGNKETI